jgi:hypothetical protein
MPEKRESERKKKRLEDFFYSEALSLLNAVTLFNWIKYLGVWCMYINFGFILFY